MLQILESQQQRTSGNDSTLKNRLRSMRLHVHFGQLLWDDIWIALHANMDKLTL